MKRPTARSKRREQSRWYLRIAVLAVCAFAVVSIYVTNQLLTQRFTETTRNRSEIRLTLYVANLMSELQRNSIVPQLLARDPQLIAALDYKDYSLSTQRLLSFVDEIGAASLMLLDAEGRTVAATDRNRLGELHKTSPYFINALRSNATIFTTSKQPNGGYSFVYSRRVEVAGATAGVLAVEVDLQKLESGWAGVSDAVFVADGEGTIVMSTEPRWRGLDEARRWRSNLHHRPLNAPCERPKTGPRCQWMLICAARRCCAARPRAVSGLAHGQLHHLFVGARTCEWHFGARSYGIRDPFGADVLAVVAQGGVADCAVSNASRPNFAH